MQETLVKALTSANSFEPGSNMAPNFTPFYEMNFIRNIANVVVRSKTLKTVMPTDCGHPPHRRSMCTSSTFETR